MVQLPLAAADGAAGVRAASMPLFTPIVGPRDFR